MRDNEGVGGENQPADPNQSGPLNPARIIQTDFGAAYCADSISLMRDYVGDQTVDLIMTSPPFGLVRKKDYGNADADEYVNWFRPFAAEFRRILKPEGSIVIDIGSAWNRGLPTKSLYQYELLVTLCKEFQFHLAQDFFWWNPSRLPTPAEWVNVRRIRVKDAVNTIWWLSRTPWPKASNRRVLQPYSDSMEQLLVNGYRAKRRPSGHDISTKFSRNNGASIPPNLLAVANTESNSRYLRYCQEHGIAPHPARFPATIPEFFIRMLTDPADFVFDPFAGSCVTGEVAERLKRKWLCGEIEERYVRGAVGRFPDVPQLTMLGVEVIPITQSDVFYKIPRPGKLWDADGGTPLPKDGGRSRPVKGLRDTNSGLRDSTEG